MIIRKKELGLEDCRTLHQREFGMDPAVVAVVPQPAVISGIFSSLTRTPRIICLAPDGITLSLSRRTDNVVRVVNIAKQDKKKFSLPNIKYRKEDKWANCVKAVFSELLKLRRDMGGWNILVSGKGASMGTTSLPALLYAGTMEAISSMENLALTPSEMIAMAERANAFSPYKASMSDMWVLLNGREGEVYLHSDDSSAVKAAPWNVKNTYLVSSSLPFSVLTPEEEEYRDSARATLDSLSREIPRLGNMSTLTSKEIKLLTARLPEWERKCLSHLVTENECTRRIFSAIAKGESRALGEALSILQRSVVTNAELTSPETDWLFRRSLESENVKGMCGIGLGFAGTFLAVIENMAPGCYSSKGEEYERIFGFHASARPFVPVGGTVLEKFS